MKTIKIIRTVAILIAVIGISAAGCKKDKEETDTSSMQQLSKDEQMVESASEDAISDANEVLTGKIGKGLDSLNWPCNVTLDSTVVSGSNNIYYLTFNGLNCSGTKLRNGKMEISFPINKHWKDIGAIATVNIINMKITKVYSGNWVIINGTKTFENVSGGLVKNLGNGVITSVVHKITGNIQVTFDDNTTRTWEVARKKTFTGTPGSLVLTIEGFGTAGGFDNLVVWGTNRKGEQFYTQIIQPVVFRQYCGWDPCSGVKIYQIPAADKKAEITFGYDDQNQPVTGNTCPTHYKVDWEKGSNTGTLYLQLP